MHTSTFSILYMHHHFNKSDETYNQSLKTSRLLPCLVTEVNSVCCFCLLTSSLWFISSIQSQKIKHLQTIFYTRDSLSSNSFSYLCSSVKNERNENLQPWGNSKYICIPIDWRRLQQAVFQREISILKPLLAARSTRGTCMKVTIFSHFVDNFLCHKFYFTVNKMLTHD